MSSAAVIAKQAAQKIAKLVEKLTNPDERRRIGKIVSVIVIILAVMITCMIYIANTLATLPIRVAEAATDFVLANDTLSESEQAELMDNIRKISTLMQRAGAAESHIVYAVITYASEPDLRAQSYGKSGWAAIYVNAWIDPAPPSGAGSDRNGPETREIYLNLQKFCQVEISPLALQKYKSAAAEIAQMDINDLQWSAQITDGAASYNGEQMIWPCPASHELSSVFGMRMHPIYGYLRMHNGIDIPAPGGSDILAAASGMVRTAHHGSTGYGNYIEIDHGGGVATLYAHASALLVQEGDLVQRGQVIALVGTTGNSTGNHLHFEVRKDGKPTQPTGYF